MSEKKNAHNPSEWLSADKPIETRQEDVLGRTAFSEAIARAVRGWLGRESIVIALYGAWGNGKTSVKNMVVEYLRSDSPEVLSVDFNPWQLASRPTLSEAFFDELGIAVGKGDLGSKSARKSLLAQYKRWAQRLQGTQDLVTAMRNLAGTVLVVLGAAIVGAGWIHSKGLTLVLGFLLLLGGTLALVSKVVDAAIKLLAVGVETGQKSLSEVKGEIANDLRRLKAPILVVLDDLDRLTPTELLEVFQLIKGNADFPNVVYLALFERGIVENNIDKALNVHGRDYLEKIVQVGFDLPMIDVARVHKVLLQRLDSLLIDESITAKFQHKRWGNVFYSGLGAYFATLRDVNRFMSTLAFQFASLSGEGAFEVNPIDLIVLEVIRLYEPEVYLALRSNKELLTSNSRPEKPLAEVAAKSVNAILEMGSKEHKQHLRNLIKHLFPTIEWALGGPQYAREFGEEWYRDLRVCTQKLFDRYFRLAVSDEELSQAAVQKLLQARGSRTNFAIELKRLHSQRLLRLGMEELAVHQDEIEPHQAEEYVIGLFDVGDLLSDEKTGVFDLPPSWRIGFLVRSALEKVGASSRGTLAADAITKTDGLYMAVDFVALISAPPETSEKNLLEESELAKLKDAAVMKIKQSASSGALASHRKIAFLLSYWKRWGNAEEVNLYIDQLTKTSGGALQFLNSLLQRSLSHGMGDHVATERHYMRRNDIEVLISMDTLAARVHDISPERLDDEQKRALAAFQKALERRKAGKSDDHPFAVD